MTKTKEEPQSKKMIFELDLERDDRFRKAIYDSKGLRKGAIKEALEEAIDDWIKKQKMR